MALPAQRNKLSRKRDQRRALLKGLAESLFIHESIVTTRPKARALRPYAEKLITKAKTDNQHNRRMVLRKISTKETLQKLFEEIGPRYADRPGGYTRIESAGWRRGDDAEMAKISLVDSTGAKEESVDAESKESEKDQKPEPTEETTTKKVAETKPKAKKADDKKEDDK